MGHGNTWHESVRQRWRQEYLPAIKVPNPCQVRVAPYFHEDWSLKPELSQNYPLHLCQQDRVLMERERARHSGGSVTDGIKPVDNNLSHTSAHIDLALDLLPGPASGLDGPIAILAGGASLPNQGGNPVVAEVGGELTVGESVREITNHTHSRAHQALRPVSFLGNDVEQLEDGLNEGLDESNLGATLVREQDATPSIHDTLTQRHDVVNHVIRQIRAGGNGGGLLKNLANDGQVVIEVGCSDSLGDISEGLQDGGFELVGGSLVAEG